MVRIFEVHILTLQFLEKNLSGNLQSEEVVLTEMGYTYYNCVHSIPGLWSKFTSRIRARHEAVNGALKRFKSLQHVVRHSRFRNETVFMAIAHIVQLETMLHREVF